jgi:hypothetical protein
VRKALSFVAYQASWWACVLGAGTAWALAGVGGTALFAVAHVVSQRDVAERRRQLRVIVVATVAGAAFDSLLVVAGFLELDPAIRLGPLPSPLWLVALWTGFGATLTSSFGWAIASLPRAVTFGALAGPAAYYGGTKLLDLRLGAPLPLSLLAVAVAWTIAMVALRRAASPGDVAAAASASMGFRSRRP